MSPILNSCSTKKKIFSFFNDQSLTKWSTRIVGFMGPVLLTSCICTLLLTNRALPTWRVGWLNKAFRHTRWFKFRDAEDGIALFKKNQFLVGQVDFNVMAFWLIGLPGLMLFVTYIKSFCLVKDDLKASIECTSYGAGWVSVVVLAFFMIPVSRHSVLLVAMNWSPIHALRIHIWAGYVSFMFVVLHGVLLVIVWFTYADGPVYREFIPPIKCLTGSFPRGDSCITKIYNMTGMIAFVFFLVLWASSLHWFRRKNYRLFYVLHVIFGTLTIIASVLHFETIVLYLLPSICYYSASTTPTLVQALASRFRGGVRIVKVVILNDSGECLEVHVSTDATTQTFLEDNHPCKYIKLCVPKISVVWHPFTVYAHRKDCNTLRFLFRPVGPFTKELKDRLISPERPVTLIDGFYRGSDHCHQALVQHDHVTIVAGGVAITPFLSMMNAVLKELSYSADREHCYGLKSMTLVWSCRELGLVSYVKRTYLEDMARTAQNVNEFVFKVNIFVTGNCETHPEQELDSDTDTTCTESIEYSERHHSKIGPSDTNLCPVRADSSEFDMFKKVPLIGYESVDTHISEDRSSLVGHPMELARMLPARYSKIKWNVPYFLAFSFTVCITFYVFFTTYMLEDTSLAQMSASTWVLLLVLLSHVVIAFAIEALCLHGSNYWPAPRPDEYSIVGDTVELEMQGATEGFHENDTSTIDTSSMFQYGSTSDTSSMFVLQYGSRPISADIFADAQLASAPGIFMCGPQALVGMVRKEAAKQNSELFLTRYALYEEVFDM